jgi:hypothetical protein
MRFETKPQPNLGDKKQKVKFAFFPTKVEEKILWLEKYTAIYEYKEYYYPTDVIVSEGIFTEKYYRTYVKTQGWIQIEKKLLTI